MLHICRNISYRAQQGPMMRTLLCLLALAWACNAAKKTIEGQYSVYTRYIETRVPGQPVETLKIQGPSLHGRASIESVGRRGIFRALKSPQLACTFKQIRPGCVTFVFFLHPHFERSQLLAAGCWLQIRSCGPSIAIPTLTRSTPQLWDVQVPAAESLAKLSELCNMTQGRVRS